MSIQNIQIIHLHDTDSDVLILIYTFTNHIVQDWPKTAIKILSPGEQSNYLRKKCDARCKGTMWGIWKKMSQSHNAAT